MDVDEQAAQLRATLRAERKARRLSQTALGVRLGRSTYQTAHKWETGTSQPSLIHFLEWAAALGFEVKLVPVARRPAQ